MENYQDQQMDSCKPASETHVCQSEPSIPKFKCIKVVGAFKIGNIIHDSDAASIENRETDGTAFLFSEDGSLAIKVSPNYLRKHNPHIGGYYVKYEDGYESFSPAEAFEKGYVPYLPDHQSVSITPTPELVLRAPSRYPLADCLKELRFGRTAADQHLLNKFINELEETEAPLHISDPFEWMKRWIDAYHKENGGVSGSQILEWISQQPMTSNQ